MSQRSVEATIGKIICDDEFRREFFSDGLMAIARCGGVLTEVELESLRRMDRARVEQLAGSLDDRIRRIDIGEHD